MRSAGAALADLGCVLLFVVIGRANHHAGGGLAGLWDTTWPFAAGTVIGLLAPRSWRRADPTRGRSRLARDPFLAAAHRARTSWGRSLAVHGGHRHGLAGGIWPGHRVRVHPGRAGVPRAVPTRLAAGSLAHGAGPGAFAVAGPRLSGRPPPDPH